MTFIQYGTGAPVGDQLLYYRPVIRRQHGYGLGSFLGSLFQRLIPFAKQHIVPFVVPHAKSAVKNLVSDVISGENVKDSLKRNTLQALKGASKDIIHQSGTGNTTVNKRAGAFSPVFSAVKKTKRKGIVKRKKAKKTKKVKKGKTKQQKGKKRKGKKRKPIAKRDLISVFDT